jgi:hypothetical protein
VEDSGHCLEDERDCSRLMEDIALKNT